MLIGRVGMLKYSRRKEWRRGGGGWGVLVLKIMGRIYIEWVEVGGGEKEGKQGDESRETKGEVRNENGGEEIEGK